MQKTTAPVSQNTEPDIVNEKLPQQEIPTPKIKMKTINWNKIPSNKVSKENVSKIRVQDFISFDIYIGSWQK